MMPDEEQPSSVISKATKAVSSPFGNMIGTMVAQLGAVGIISWILVNNVDYLQEDIRDQRRELRNDIREERDKIRGDVKDERERTRERLKAITKSLHELVMEIYELRRELGKGTTTSRTFSKTSDRLDQLKKDLKKEMK